MAISRAKKTLAFSLSFFVAAISSWALAGLDGLREVENRIWDWRVRATAAVTKPQDIKIIEVDQRSLDRMAERGVYWPWPRAGYAKIIKFLERSGAKGLAFDVLFTETSSYGKEDDKKFAAAMGGNLPVLQMAAVTNAARDLDESRFEIFAEKLEAQNSRSGYIEWYSNHLPAQPEFESVILPVPEILEAGRSFGNVSADPDSDGVMRHYSAGAEVRGLALLNSPFAFYDLVKADLKDKDLKRFLDADGRFTVNFNGAVSFDGVSAEAVMQSYDQLLEGQQPLISPDYFKDSWVYLGLTAPGLLDLKPTPVDRRGKAVEFLAAVLKNLIEGSFIKKAGIPFNLLFSLLFSGTIAAVVFFRPQIQQLPSILLLFGLFIAVQFFAAAGGHWLSFTMPFMGGTLSLVLSLALQYYFEGRQHKFIRNAFRHYVSPSLIQEIVKNPESLSLGGERRELSIFFSDIEGFTSISEKLKAAELVALMNSFLSEMTQIIQLNQGTVDKYIGDAIVAFWNAPLEVNDHAYLAVKTALDCQKRLRELGAKYKEEYGVELRMRVGINTAPVSVGNFGSRERFSYTAIGDGMNLASRLEGANKYFSTLILMTDATAGRLGGRVQVRRIGRLRVVGKSETVEIYEPRPEAGRGEIELFNRAVASFETRDFETALKLFKELAPDPVARAYIIRLESEMEKREDINWSPVWELSSK